MAETTEDIGFEGDVASAFVANIDAITEILVRLDVKPLARGKCVSKTWCWLINDPSFIKLHLNHRLSMMSSSSELNINQPDLTLLFFKNEAMFTFNFAHIVNPRAAPVYIHPYPDQIHVNGSPFHYILGSCNELICFISFKSGYSVVIYNPSIRKSRVVSVPVEFSCHFKQQSSEGSKYGFFGGIGYDSFSDDHKVVLGTPPLESTSLRTSSLLVYNMRSDSWKRGPDFPVDLIGFQPGAVGKFVNNALHWLAVPTMLCHGESNYLVIGYDLHNEKYREISMPHLYDDQRTECYYPTALCVLGGFLCSWYRDEFVMEGWVMMDYDVNDTWTKLFTISQNQFVSLTGLILRRPIFYSKGCGKVLFAASFACEEFAGEEFAGNPDKVHVRTLSCFFLPCR